MATPVLASLIASWLVMGPAGNPLDDCRTPGDVASLEERELKALYACHNKLLEAAERATPRDQERIDELKATVSALDKALEKKAQVKASDGAEWDALVKAHVGGIKNSTSNDGQVVVVGGALEFTSAQEKSGGGAKLLSQEATEALAIVADIAVKRARQQGLGAVKARLEDVVCGLTLPEKIDSQQAPALPNTCRLIRGTALERLAGDPRPVQKALYSDLLGVVIQALLKSGGLAVEKDMKRLLDAAIAVAGRVTTKRDFAASTWDAAAIADMLIDSRGIDPNTRIQWGKARAVPIGLSAAALFLSDQNRRTTASTHSLAQIVGVLTAEVTRGVQDVDDSTFARALELANLVILAKAANVDDFKTDPQERLLAGIDGVFLCLEIHAEGQQDAERSAKLKLMHAIVRAAVDHDPATALAQGAMLLQLHLPPLAAEPSTSRKGRDKDAKTATAIGATRDTDEETRRYHRRLTKATAMLTAVAAYAETYRTAPGPSGEASNTRPEELHERRKAALEGLIDATTVRDQRHGEVVFSLGIPLGFAAGYQGIRERARDDMGALIVDAQGNPTNRWKRSPMAPQLEIPLGFAVQKLVGGRVASGKRAGDGRFYADGFHLFVSLIDLGQFLSFDDTGKINRPRWDTIVSPGLQLGWMFGTPRNSFILGIEGRYAPTLFAGTSKLTVLPQEDPGGALRAGMFLAYYIPLFDFN